MAGWFVSNCGTRYESSLWITKSVAKRLPWHDTASLPSQRLRATLFAATPSLAACS